MVQHIWSVRSMALGAAALGLSGLGAAAQAQGVEHHYTAEQFEGFSANMKEGLSNVTIPTGPGAVVISVRRDRDGEVEVHKKMADLITARKGAAQIRVGGTAEGQRQTAPDEFRGGKQVGGKVYDLKPGDTIYIAPGQPHQMLVKKGAEFRYMAVKFGPTP